MASLLSIVRTWPTTASASETVIVLPQGHQFRRGQVGGHHDGAVLKDLGALGGDPQQVPENRLAHILDVFASLPEVGVLDIAKDLQILLDHLLQAIPGRDALTDPGPDLVQESLVLEEQFMICMLPL